MASFTPNSIFFFVFPFIGTWGMILPRTPKKGIQEKYDILKTVHNSTTILMDISLGSIKADIWHLTISGTLFGMLRISG